MRYTITSPDTSMDMNMHEKALDRIGSVELSTRARVEVLAINKRQCDELEDYCFREELIMRDLDF